MLRSRATYIRTSKLTGNNLVHNGNFRQIFSTIDSLKSPAKLNNLNGLLTDSQGPGGGKLQFMKFVDSVACRMMNNYVIHLPSRSV